MLRAMKQRALSAAVADSVTNSSRDSPTVSLSGKGRTPHPPASCSVGRRVRGGAPSLVLAVNSTCWKQGFSPVLSIRAEASLRTQCRPEGAREVQGGRRLPCCRPSAAGCSHHFPRGWLGSPLKALPGLWTVSSTCFLSASLLLSS